MLCWRITVAVTKGQAFMFFEACGFVDIDCPMLLCPRTSRWEAASFQDERVIESPDSMSLVSLWEKGVTLCCIMISLYDSMVFRLVLPFFIFLQTGLQVGIRMLHSILLYFLSHFFCFACVGCCLQLYLSIGSTHFRSFKLWMLSCTTW